MVVGGGLQIVVLVRSWLCWKGYGDLEFVLGHKSLYGSLGHMSYCIGHGSMPIYHRSNKINNKLLIYVH